MSDNGLTAEMKQYREALVVALRIRDVPGRRIGEIVAEAESHVAETGEDPVSAFGSAREYAEQFPQGTSPWRFRSIGGVALGLIAGICVAQGLTSPVHDRGLFWSSIPGWVGIPIGLVLGVAAVLLIPHQDREPVIDPRTGKEIGALPRWVGPVVVVSIVAVLSLLRWVF